MSTANPQPSTGDAQSDYLWWQKGIIYQVYPRSFMDSNGDGIGDLNGVTSRLDYLQWLGIDAVWLSPIYPSPMADFGYDISNYADVNPMFGTLADFDRLVSEAHGRGLKVILDLVPNHTSGQHPWFLESRSSPQNPKRDWYLWAGGKPGGEPPNNWLSRFGGSAWEWDEKTGQYYLHTFLKEQPDLNWRNPQVKEVMFNSMRFWLDHGVDGFRVDVMWWLIKDEQLRDDPPNPDYDPSTYEPYFRNLATYSNSINSPEVHDVIREMRQVLDEYDGRMMVGEIYLTLERLVRFYGDELDECQLPFNFLLIGRTDEAGRTTDMPFQADILRAAVNEYESLLPEGGWPNWVLGNHDRSRVASRVGREKARLAQMLLLTLRGTPTCYYGDELGMQDVDIPPDKVQDPWGVNVPGHGVGRDPERTPMQWDPNPNAGFSTTEPWLPVAPDYKRINVQVEQQEPASILNMFRALTHLRRSTPALAVGSYVPVEAGSKEVYAYLREHESQKVLVLLNFGGEEQTLDLSNQSAQGRVLISTLCDRSGPVDLPRVQIRPYEGLIVGLSS